MTQQEPLTQIPEPHRLMNATVRKAQPVRGRERTNRDFSMKHEHIPSGFLARPHRQLPRISLSDSVDEHGLPCYNLSRSAGLVEQEDTLS